MSFVKLAGIIFLIGFALGIFLYDGNGLGGSYAIKDSFDLGISLTTQIIGQILGVVIFVLVTGAILCGISKMLKLA